MSDMDLLTLSEARTALRPHMEAGACDNAAVDARIYEAERRLWVHADWRLSRRRIVVRTQNNSFCLPIEVEKILFVDVDGKPSLLFDRAYEYMNSGPGDLDRVDKVGSGIKDIVDMGEFPTQFDIPIVLSGNSDDTLCEATESNGYKLVAFSPFAADATKELTIRGFDRRGDEIRTEQSGVLTPGEKLRINRWQDGVEGQIYGAWGTAVPVTTNLFKQVSQVYKPATKGPVALYAVDTSTNEVFLLSKMTPDSLRPSYRRYRITNTCGCDEDSCSVLTLLVKVRHRKATWDDDILSIQNLPALKAMFMAIKFENSGQLQDAQAYESQALRILTDEKKDRELAAGTPVCIDHLAECMSRPMNRGYVR